MTRSRRRIFAASAVLTILLIALWALSEKPQVTEAPQTPVPEVVSAPAVKIAPGLKTLAKKSEDQAPPDEGPAPMVILEEIVIDQRRKGIGASPDIDAALARLPGLEKCVEETLEIVRLPSLDSHIRMHVGILKRFKKANEARAWLQRARACSPHARMEIIKAYFLE